MFSFPIPRKVNEVKKAFLAFNANDNHNANHFQPLLNKVADHVSCEARQNENDNLNENDKENIIET